MSVSMSELDDLLNDLGIDNVANPEQDKLIEYLNKCGGFDVVSFDGSGDNRKQQKKAAEDYEAEMRAKLDPAKVMVERKNLEVWLIVLDFYYKLNGDSTPDAVPPRPPSGELFQDPEYGPEYDAGDGYDD